MLSNTNCLHWPRLINEFKLDRYIELARFFPSFQVQMAKPDPEIFLYALQKLDVDASQILFLDDSLVNVKAARAALVLKPSKFGVLTKLVQVLE